MKEYMPICNRLAGGNKLADKCKFTKAILFIFAIGMNFASTTKLCKILIKNIKQHFKNF